jgi:spore photoproduct lyase
MCRAYPGAEVIERPAVPHNRVDLGPGGPLRQHEIGKRTLVLGVHQSAVRLSEESGNTCPNYWHFSPYGFCPFGCAYCYLAGTPGVWFSPVVKVYLNLGKIVAQVANAARSLDQPAAFYLGKLQDGLALDPLTGYSRVLVPFFAAHSTARMILLTKSSCVENLLDLDHREHTILSWSLNPDPVINAFEANTPPLADRLAAMSRAAAAGYPLRAVIMPLIPVPDWPAVYEAFLRELLARVPLQRLTFGGICSYPNARRLMEVKLGSDNTISAALDRHSDRHGDGRIRYPLALRIEMYRHLISIAHTVAPELQIGLCLEERSVFETLGMTNAIGRCNCVL